DREVEEAALDRAVEEREARGGAQTDAFGERGAAGENPGGPARQAPLHHVAELLVERAERGDLSRLEALAVGRIGDQEPGTGSFRRGFERTRLEADRARDAGALGVHAGEANHVGVRIGAFDDAEARIATLGRTGF